MIGCAAAGAHPDVGTSVGRLASAVNWVRSPAAQCSPLWQSGAHSMAGNRGKDFSQDYVLAGTAAMLALECCTLGSDYCATSWTTRTEADWVTSALSVQRSSRLLEIGAGAGWPALYIAKRTGCEAVLLDLPFVGAVLARERAASDGIASRCTTMVGDASRLPFADRSFDAIDHSDVLCCTPLKHEILLECRRVVRAHGTMAFSVIAMAPSLPPGVREAAIAAGPGFVDTADEDYARMLERSGWRVAQHVDVTAAFVATLQCSLAGMNERAADIATAIGAQQFAGKVERRAATLTAARAGLITREVFVAVPA